MSEEKNTDYTSLALECLRKSGVDAPFERFNTQLAIGAANAYAQLAIAQAIMEQNKLIASILENQEFEAEHQKLLAVYGGAG